MTHPDIATLFASLDRWRHLPAYQLERRADIYFGLFLPDVLNHHLGSRNLTIDPRIIPEFPLGQAASRRSDKADYFALSARLGNVSVSGDRSAGCAGHRVEAGCDCTRRHCPRSLPDRWRDQHVSTDCAVRQGGGGWGSAWWFWSV